jgi:hypothetical protein
MMQGGKSLKKSAVKNKIEQHTNGKQKKGWYRIMMIKNQFTIGLFDKDTEQQEIQTNEAKNLIAEILIGKFGIFAFTMIECSGVYRMASSGRIVFEPSIRVEIASDDEIAADDIIEELKDTLNQESIMHEVSKEHIYFK